MKEMEKYAYMRNTSKIGKTRLIRSQPDCLNWSCLVLVVFVIRYYLEEIFSFLASIYWIKIGI